MFLLGFRRKWTTLALCKSIESAIQLFQIHQRITFATIQNPAVYLFGRKGKHFSYLGSPTIRLTPRYLVLRTVEYARLPLKRQSRLQQTTIFDIFLNFQKKIWYFMRIVYLNYLLFLRKQQNLKLSSAAHFRGRFTSNTVCTWTGSKGFWNQ